MTNDQLTDRRSRIITSIPIVGSLVLCCAVMTVVELFIAPTYAVKSLIKVFLFVLIPMLVIWLTHDRSVFRVFVPDFKACLFPLLAGAGLYAIIFGAYMLLGGYFDLSGIASSLNEVGVAAENFVFVSIYISLCNSFIEEFIFRGFAFLGLVNKIGTKWACVVSALCFSLYHIAMMIGWYTLPLMLLVIFALFIGGLLLNWLDVKTQTLYPSWIVHIFANLAINTIGMIILGII